MMPKPSAKYLHCGPLMLAKLTHKFEGIDDTEFLAIQDAVCRMTWTEQEMYRQHYIRLFGMLSGKKRKGRKR